MLEHASMRREQLRIMYVMTSLAVGGAEGSLLELIRRLDRAHVRPVVCSLIAGGELREPLKALGVPVVELGVRPGFPEMAGLRLLPPLLRFRPYIVHSRLILSNLWARLGRLVGAHVICEERGLALERPWFMTALNRATQPLCSINVANCVAVANRLKQRDHIRDSRLRVIYGGVDPDRFSPARGNAAQEFDLVAVSRLETYKGVFDLVHAIAQVVRHRAHARLAIVGSGSQRAAVEREIEHCGLKSNVFLRGSTQDVPSELRGGRILVNASHEEGWPNVVLEAMACGMPVVATAVGGTPELIVDGSTGLLVEPRNPSALSDAIMRYLDDPAATDRHGKAGRQRVQDYFHIRRTIESYERLYHELSG